MASKKKGGKGKKGKKGKKKVKVRKFNLDLFGILTLTRVHGEPLESFLTSGDDKKGKGKKAAPKKGKKGKKGKGKKEETAPRLPQFPPVPENLVKDAKKIRAQTQEKDEPDIFIPTTNIGHKEKTTRPPKPIEEGGSITDVMCGKKYPLPPRPQPHGAVYGDVDCMVCKSTGGLLKDPYDKLHKKLRKMFFTAFDKAEFIIKWLTDRMTDSLQKYEGHMNQILDELGPILDALDDSEWDDHFETRALVDKWRDMKKQLDELRIELKQFRKNREEVIANSIADKLKKLEEVERQMLALEKKIQEAMESLKDWQENSDKKLADAEADIAATIALLNQIRDSVLNERDVLRQLLGWEMKVATEDTVAIMEKIIKEDLDEILSWMHPSWFKLFLENKKMQEEKARLKMENHLLDLEVMTLHRQVDRMEKQKREIEGSKTHFLTPPGLDTEVDRYTRFYDDFALLQLQDYPTTRLIHEGVSYFYINVNRREMIKSFIC